MYMMTGHFDLRCIVLSRFYVAILYFFFKDNITHSVIFLKSICVRSVFCLKSTEDPQAPQMDLVMEMEMVLVLVHRDVQVHVHVYNPVLQRH